MLLATSGLDRLDRRSRSAVVRSTCAGCRELLLLAVLYVAYSGTRLLADDALAPAVGRAHALVDVEHLPRS